MTRSNRPKVGIISLGCPRNLVDSEVLLGILKSGGFEIVDLSEADIGIVNTCAFIEDAKKESIEMILELAKLKKTGKLRTIVVAGCMSQRYGKKLEESLPEVDLFIGVDQIVEIVHILKVFDGKKRVCSVSTPPSFLYDDKHPRLFITPGHYIYVKISEGCGNRCSYCVIPSIKGPYRSRPIESIERELEAAGGLRKISEINLIGQDTTLYGTDLYKSRAVSDLLKRLCAFKEYKRWIRLLYTYPTHVDDALLDTIASEESICKYLDLPIQHINESILKKMNRNMQRRDIESLIKRARKKIPQVMIRSSIIVGFPGETPEQFEELLEFVKEIRFERLGVFTYSREESTPACNYDGQLDEDVKIERFDRIMEAQKDVAGSINETYLGKTLEVLIDEPCEGEEGIYMARTQGDAPEVDGEVFVSSKNAVLKSGDFVRVRIKDTLEYDLVGDIDEPSE